MVGLFKRREGGFSNKRVGASYSPRGKESWRPACAFLRGIYINIFFF